MELIYNVINLKSMYNYELNINVYPKFIKYVKK